MLACDLRFASRENTLLGQWEVGVGVVPGGGPMARLSRLVGRGRALEILLVAGALGYMLTFALIARVEPNALVAASFGMIPLAIGIGYFIDSRLVRRDLRASG